MSPITHHTSHAAMNGDPQVRDVLRSMTVRRPCKSGETTPSVTVTILTPANSSLLRMAWLSSWSRAIRLKELRDDEIELACLGKLQQFRETASVTVRAAYGAIGKHLDDLITRPHRIVPAQRHLIVDRPVALQVCRKSGIDRGAVHEGLGGRAFISRASCGVHILTFHDAFRKRFNDALDFRAQDLWIVAVLRERKLPRGWGHPRRRGRSLADVIRGGAIS